MDALSATRSPEAERGADGFLSGLAIGVVTANDDESNLGRVRVRLPWHADGDSSFWARTSVLMAGPDRGAYFVPDIDDEVLVGFENGDPSHPYVLGGLWSKRHPPPATNSDGNNNERLIQTRSGHVLRFSDDKDAPEAELGLADGRHLKLDKDTIVLEDGDGQNLLKINTSSGSIELKAGSRLQLEAPTISIKATTSMEINGGSALTLKGGVVNIN